MTWPIPPCPLSDIKSYFMLLTYSAVHPLFYFPILWTHQEHAHLRIFALASLFFWKCYMLSEAVLFFYNLPPLFFSLTFVTTQHHKLAFFLLLLPAKTMKDLRRQDLVCFLDCCVPWAQVSTWHTIAEVTTVSDRWLFFLKLHSCMYICMYVFVHIFVHVHMPWNTFAR